jgi:predicted ATP-dependent endonuclease of OLD family
MRIRKFFLKNFRSIGEKGLELSFPIGSTILIGENNVGKTSIFEAIKMMINLEVFQKIPLDIENWYASDQSKSIDLILTIELNDDDIAKIITFFEPLQISNDSFKKLFSNRLIYRILFTTPNDIPESFFTLGELTIHNNGGRVGNFEGKNTRYGVDWKNLVDLGKIESIEKSIRKFLAIQWKSNVNQEGIADTLDIGEVSIMFAKNFPNLFLDFLKEDIISIEEYREKPKKELNASLVSPTGESLVSILFNLKNGRYREKAKFEKIKQEFHEIFPNLNLDVIKEGEEYKILTQKSSVESTTHFLGAGILQILLLVTHIVAHKNKIILIDHPEVHLHPHAERNLSTLIDESEDTQIFLITHSTYFVNIDKRHRILRVTQKDSQTEVYTMQPEHFSDKEYSKLEYLLDLEGKEMFFARKVLLVEGPTEYGAIPVFAKAQKYSFDKNGVSIIDVGGKSNIGLFARLCEGYHIPYQILADGDAAAELKQIDIPNKSKKNRLNILSKDFESILPEDLMLEAKKNVGRSKPRIGKYVATEMVNRKLDVPPEISKLIVKLKELQV